MGETQQELNVEYTNLCTQIGDCITKANLHKEQVELYEEKLDQLKRAANKKSKEKPTVEVKQQNEKKDE